MKQPQIRLRKRDAPNGRSRQNSSPRKPQEAEQAELSQSIREVYRKLASAL
jgi:hypothetical protein